MGIFIGLGIFLLSFAGIIYVLGRKIPVLLNLPPEPPGEEKEVVEKLKERLLNLRFAKLLSSPELFLQTLLSKIRILALRLEAKTGELLANLRKKSQKKNNNRFSENFWDKLKNKSI